MAKGKPLRITCIKPDDTVSLIPHTSAGIEPVFSNCYKRKTTMDISIQISDERLEDFMVVVIEDFGHGSFKVVDTDGPIWSGDDGMVELHQVPLRNGSITFKDKYGDSDNHYILDLTAIKRGLEVMAKDYPKHFMDLISEADDVITGDVFLQCALLGEVEYV